MSGPGARQLAIGALVVIAVAASAHAGPIRSAGPLAMETHGELVLGRDRTAVIWLRRPPAGQLRLVTTAGQIAALTTEGERLRATWTLPVERWPRVAIVAAIDDTGRIRDWLAIPLAGRGQVRVATTPRATVSLMVAGAEYGPVRADAGGTAVLAIEAPPGVTQGTATVTDREGNTTDQPVPLDPKAFATALVSCRVDGGGVEVLAITAVGLPASSPPPAVASVGRLAAPTVRGPGWYELPYRPGSETATKVIIRLPSPIDPALASSCSMTVPPEAPSAVRVIASASRHVAGGHDPITLTVELVYPGRRPPAPAEVELVPDLGTISPARLTTIAGGQSTWSLPDDLRGAQRATVRVRVVGDAHGELAASTSVTLEAGPIAKLEVQPPPRVRADGRSSVELVILALDAFGNRVATADLVGRARGQVGRFTAGADGTFTAAYTPPVARAPADDRLQVIETGSGVRADARIPLAPIPRRFSVAARLGYLDTRGAIAAPLAAVAATMRLPVLDEAAFVGLEAQVATGTAAVATADGSESITVRVTMTPLVLRLGYRLERGRLGLWGSLDGGALAVWTSTSSLSAGRHAERALVPVAGGALGAGLYARPVWLLAEVGYRHARIVDGSVTGRVGGLALTAGVGIDL